MLLLAVLAIFALPCQAISLHSQNELWFSLFNWLPAWNKDPPAVFAAVFSNRNGFRRRHALRAAWAHVPADTQLLLKFAICEKPSKAEDPKLTRALDEELSKSSDTLILDCADGVEPTKHTKKLLAAMQAYREHYSNWTVFMKIEDDSFVPWMKLRQFVSKLDPEWIYMGMPIAAGRKVNRDNSSKWYQPEATYSPSTYPLYMQRAGYAIGRKVVQLILDKGIAAANILSNEDQAAGVWVNEAHENFGNNVQFVTLRGRYNFDVDDPGLQGTWKDYPYLLHHGLNPGVMKCLGEADALNIEDQLVPDCSDDSFFVAVAVFSSRANIERRNGTRNMLRTYNSTMFDTKFMLCNGNGTSDGLESRLRAESDQFHDIVFLDCEEGYANQLLTKKLVKTLEAYRSTLNSSTYFMKVDDDTFVSMNRLRRFLGKQNDDTLKYMGLRSYNGVPVNRDNRSLWYQPFDTYPNETYPEYMEGGTGYILSKDLLLQLLERQIPQSMLLSNEDQAMGVWIHKMTGLGVPVEFVDIPGTNGYRPEYDVCSGTWGSYPYLLHHRVSSQTIASLALLDFAGDARASIDDAFEVCESTGKGKEDLSMRTESELSMLPSSTQSIELPISMLAVNVTVRKATRKPRKQPRKNQSTNHTTPRNLSLGGHGLLAKKAKKVVDKKNQSTNHTTLRNLSLGGHGLIAKKAKKVVDKKNVVDRTLVPTMFIHIPKNAGTAIEEAGARAKQWWPRKWRSFWRDIKMPPGKALCMKYHVPPHYLAKIKDPQADVYAGKTFCVSRDPYERAVSEYSYMLQVEWGEPMSRTYETDLLGQPRCTAEGLNNFLQNALKKVKTGTKYIHDCHFVPQSEYVWGPNGKQWCKKVLRADKLPAAFNDYMIEMGLPSVKLTSFKINNSSRGCNRLNSSMLSDETARLIEEIYHDDFVKLGYAKRSHAKFLPPRTRSK